MDQKGVYKRFQAAGRAAGLQMVLLAPRPGQRLLHHIERGNQYTSHDYQRLLAENKISCSISSKGNCSR